VLNGQIQDIMFVNLQLTLGASKQSSKFLIAKKLNLRQN